MSKGYTIIELLIVLLVVVSVVSWVWNALKLASCDFEPNYKCELLHWTGFVVTPLSIITVWFADDGE